MSDDATDLARARLMSALGKEDAQLAETINSIRDDQRSGLITDSEAADNISVAEHLHKGHCDLLTAALKYEVT